MLGRLHILYYHVYIANYRTTCYWMDLIVYLLGFTLIIPHSEGNTKFTSKPPSVVYVSSGEVATLTWNYIVQDRLVEFKDHSPTWHLYLQNGTSIQLAYENKRTRKWTLSESCPSRLRSRLVINNSSSLVIKEATIEDSGTYGCTLNLTNRPPITSRADLNITGPEFTNAIPQTIMLREGKDLSVICKARGIPTPVVKWLRLEKGRKVLITQGIGNAVLEKRNVRREFNGTYECQASNDGNNPNVFISNRTDILVQYRPSIDSISSSPITIKSWDDNSLILRCMAEGNPIPQVSWIGPDKQPIKYGVSSSISGSLLAIQTEKSQDFGQYRCRASNSIGYVYRYIEVRRIVVPDPPMILKIQSTASTIEITWRRPTLDGGSPIIDYQISINTKPLRAVSVKGTSVIIAGLSKATEYQVNVLARNVVGYSNATSTDISTKNEDGMANEQMSGSVVLGVCLPIIFILLLVIVLILVYNWWKRRKEKHAYAKPAETTGKTENDPGTELQTIKIEDGRPKQNGIAADYHHKNYNGSCFQPFIKRQKRRPRKSKTPRPLEILDPIKEENAEEESTEEMAQNKQDDNDNIRNSSDVVIEPKEEEEEEEEDIYTEIYTDASSIA